MKPDGDLLICPSCLDLAAPGLLRRLGAEAEMSPPITSMNLSKMTQGGHSIVGCVRLEAKGDTVFYSMT